MTAFTTVHIRLNYGNCGEYVEQSAANLKERYDHGQAVVLVERVSSEGIGSEQRKNGSQ
jgi:hypothetical protein